MAGMGAVVMRDFGGPEVLEWAEVPRPVAEGDRVLVRVAACGLNHLDLWTRSGHRGRSIPLPHILGNEPVGFVEEVGPRAEGVAPGDFVVVAPGFLDRFRADRSGWDTRYPEYGVIGNRAPGGYGEYLAVRAEHVVRVSDRWSPEEWAATPLVFLTAWHMLVGRARLRPGETVLVVGAGSGVGSSAVQIARHFACRVIATAGTREKLSAAKELGAHAAVLHGQDAWSAEVREASGGRGVDVVVEHVGEAIFEDAVKTLAHGGRLVTCGSTTGPSAHLNLTHLFAKQLSILGSYMGDHAELLDVLRLLDAGKLKPVVDRVFPVREAAKAHARMENREHFGKIVLRHGA